MPNFVDIIGQDAALAQLQRALAGRRRPHAYIFAGPDGVGRRTTAIEFSKLLLCAAPATSANQGRFPDLPDRFALQVACGDCPYCRTASAGTNGDLQLVYKELARYHDDVKVRDRVMQDLGVDVIRQFLIAPAYRAAAGGHGKAFIVLGAEVMSVPAQNALLKTLEEPPPGVTIILTCHSPAELLPTTRSRCQAVPFRPLPIDLVASSLEEAGITPAEARFWASFSGGSLGQAGALAQEEDMYKFKRDLGELLASLSPAREGLLAEALTKAMDAQAHSLRARDRELAPTLASRQAGQTLLALLASFYRDALTRACDADRPLVHADQPGPIRKLASQFDAPAVADILAQLSRYEELLWRNVNPKLLWDNVALTCAGAAAVKV